MNHRTLRATSILSMTLLSTMWASLCRGVELLHYTFDQVDTDGTIFTTPDSSGRGNTGTLTSMDNVNPVPGRVGNALEFSAVDTLAPRDRIEVLTADVNATTDLNRTYTQFTFAAFVKPVGIAAEEADTTWLAGKLGTSSTRGWQIGLTGTDPPTLVHPDEIVVSLFEGPLTTDNDNEFYSGPQTAVVNDQWAHVAFTFSSVTEPTSFFRMYINGVKVVDAPTDLTQMNGVNTRAFQVGNRGDQRADSWLGLIDEVYLFDHALTDGEIAALIPAAPMADFDDDNDVDGADFLVWQRGLGTASGATNAQGNADGDQDVDGADLGIWKSTFGSSTIAAITSSAPVPEPTAWQLLLVALVGIRCSGPFYRVRPAA